MSAIPPYSPAPQWPRYSPPVGGWNWDSPAPEYPLYGGYLSGPAGTPPYPVGRAPYEPPVYDAPWQWAAPPPPQYRRPGPIYEAPPEYSDAPIYVHGRSPSLELLAPRDPAAILETEPVLVHSPADEPPPPPLPFPRYPPPRGGVETYVRYRVYPPWPRRPRSPPPPPPPLPLPAPPPPRRPPPPPPPPPPPQPIPQPPPPPPPQPSIPEPDENLRIVVKSRNPVLAKRAQEILDARGNYGNLRPEDIDAALRDARAQLEREGYRF